MIHLIIFTNLVQFSAFHVPVLLLQNIQCVYPFLSISSSIWMVCICKLETFWQSQLLSLGIGLHTVPQYYRSIGSRLYHDTISNCIGASRYSNRYFLIIFGRKIWLFSFLALLSAKTKTYEWAWPVHIT